MSKKCAVCGKAAGKLLKCSRCVARFYCSSTCQVKDWPFHKANCKRQNYILKVDLCPRHITHPSITRTLSCPATATFADLHEALQVAFGWAKTHLYDFEVIDNNDTRGSENRLSFTKLIMTITDMRTSEDLDTAGPRLRDSSKILLHKVLDGPKTRGKTIHYRYDFGDSWEHVIYATGRTEPTVHFECIGGEGHGCAEDVGGISGWNELLEAYDAEAPSGEQKENMDWFETCANNKDPGGLRGEAKWIWDQDRINAVFKEFKVSESHASAAPNTPASKSLLLISLEKEPWVDEMYAPVLATLRSKAILTEVTHIASAMQQLTSQTASFGAIIVTDSAIMKDDYYRAVTEMLLIYTRRGGTVIFGFLCSSFITPGDLARFFYEVWSLPWKYGNYDRSMCSIHSNANKRFTDGSYPSIAPYSMKAVYLHGVESRGRVYVSNDRKNDCAAAFADYGDGHVGWVGDVNAESESTMLYVAMCGL